MQKPADDVNMTKKCASAGCGKFYHDECTKTSDLFRKDSSNKNAFICPHHTCATCFSENPNISECTHAFKGKFMKCVRCPKAYHSGEFCISAGSFILAGCNIVCSDHFQPIKGLSQHNRVNVAWCFVCCKNGELIGCNKCPASYHLNCIEDPPESLIASTDKHITNDQAVKKRESVSPVSSPKSVDQHSPSSTMSSDTTNTVNSANSNQMCIVSSNWTCEDCVLGKRPLYGQIVWAKVG